MRLFLAKMADALTFNFRLKNLHPPPNSMELVLEPMSFELFSNAGVSEFV
jgi:hypothetical protein